MKKIRIDVKTKTGLFICDEFWGTCSSEQAEFFCHMTGVNPVYDTITQEVVDRTKTWAENNKIQLMENGWPYTFTVSKLDTFMKVEKVLLLEHAEYGPYGDDDEYIHDLVIIGMRNGKESFLRIKCSDQQDRPGMYAPSWSAFCEERALKYIPQGIETYDFLDMLKKMPDLWPMKWLAEEYDKNGYYYQSVFFHP